MDLKNGFSILKGTPKGNLSQDDVTIVITIEITIETHEIMKNLNFDFFFQIFMIFEALSDSSKILTTFFKCQFPFKFRGDAPHPVLHEALMMKCVLYLVSRIGFGTLQQNF